MDVTPQELFAVIGEQQVKLQLAEVQINKLAERIQELEKEKLTDDQKEQKKG